MEFKKPFYKLSEVMEMLQVSRPTLYREIKAGRLEAYVIAGEYRVSAEALEKLKYKPGKSQQPLPEPIEEGGAENELDYKEKEESEE